MADTDPKALDPRIRRTRALLQEALVRLLEKRNFDEISVQDVAEEATVNRATFYAHYPDKYALLECTTAGRFLDLLQQRGVKFDGTCGSVLGMIFLGICDYLARAMGCSGTCQRRMDPHMESAIVAVVRGMILDGLKQHAWESPTSREMVATTISWALYGAAKEWLITPDRPSAEEVADTVTALVSPLLHPTSSMKREDPLQERVRSPRFLQLKEGEPEQI